MPKSKKKKKQDFQKVKLKVGKRLPKGENVSNLSFKTRQIQMTQKIKDDEGAHIVTKKKLNVQDLLRQCDHHSSSSRVNAVSGLKEMWLNNYEELMVPTNVHGYGTVLKKLSTMLIDNEAVVRHCAINLFKMILNKVSKKSQEKYRGQSSLDGKLFTHIHTFLCCAMNHIHEDIKLDALVLFDALLDTFPHLMVQQTGDLLKNLIGLISSPVYLGAKGNSTTQRLSINPDSKLPAMKFRANVLLRMKKIFTAALKDPSGIEKPEANDASEHSESLVKRWNLYADAGQSHVKRDTRLQSSVFEHKFNIIFQSGGLDADDHVMDTTGLESFFQIAIPVLLQCWKEAYASLESDSNDLLLADSAEVMSYLVCVIQQMLVLYISKIRTGTDFNDRESRKVEIENVANSYLRDFESAFMANFPYSAHTATPGLKDSKKRAKKSRTVDIAAVQAKVSSLNLGICEIMCSFCLGTNFSLKSKLIKEIGKHIVKILHTSVSLEQTRIAVRCIRNVFSNGQCRGFFSKVYKSALSNFKSSSVKSSQKRELYNLFAHMVRTWKGWDDSDFVSSDDQNFQLLQSEITDVLEKFIHSLPNLLLSVHTSLQDSAWLVQILQLMSLGHVQKCCKMFSSAFREQLPAILDPQTGLLSLKDEQVQQHLFFLLSMGTPLSRDDLKQLLHALRRPTSLPSICRRRSWSCVSHALYSIFSNIRECVPLKHQDDFSNLTAEQKAQLSDYLRFLFSLQLGFSGEELDTLCPVEKEGICFEQWMTVDLSLDGDQLERHLEIANIVSRELANFSIPAQPSKGHKHCFTFIPSIEHLWLRTFKQRRKIHVLSVFGLLHLLCQCRQHHVAHKPDAQLLNLAASGICAVLVALYSVRDVVSSGGADAMPVETVKWRIKTELVSGLTSRDESGLKLLDLIMDLLQKRSNGAFDASEEDKQAAKTSCDFLLSDESIKSILNRR